MGRERGRERERGGDFDSFDLNGDESALITLADSALHDAHASCLAA